MNILNCLSPRSTQVMVLLSVLAMTPLQASMGAIPTVSGAGIYFSVPSEVRYDWYESQEYCQQLTPKQHWQLPSYDQLQTLFEMYHGGHLMLDGWPVNSIYDIWSGTAVPGARHLSLNLYRGGISDSRNWGRHYVSCVRWGL